MLVTWVAVAAVGALAAVDPQRASAQEPDDQWVRSFFNLERSHIDHPVGRRLIFEDQLAPQIIVAAFPVVTFWSSSSSGTRMHPTS